MSVARKERGEETELINLYTHVEAGGEGQIRGEKDCSGRIEKKTLTMPPFGNRSGAALVDEIVMSNVGAIGGRDGRRDSFGVWVLSRSKQEEI